MTGTSDNSHVIARNRSGSFTQFGMAWPCSSARCSTVAASSASHRVPVSSGRSASTSVWRLGSRPWNRRGRSWRIPRLRSVSAHPAEMAAVKSRRLSGSMRTCGLRFGGTGGWPRPAVGLVDGQDSIRAELRSQQAAVAQGSDHHTAHADRALPPTHASDAVRGQPDRDRGGRSDTATSYPSAGGGARTGPSARRPPRSGCAPRAPAPPRSLSADGRQQSGTRCSRAVLMRAAGIVQTIVSRSISFLVAQPHFRRVRRREHQKLEGQLHARPGRRGAHRRHRAGG